MTATRILFAAFLALGFAPRLIAGDVDFARDVLPVLSENCFHCHGPDPNTREAGLRLDTQDGAFRRKKDRAMIVPGKSLESEVVRRVLSRDPDEVMPPPTSNRKLTPKQAEALQKWVDDGAKWGQHWAFVPLPKTVPVPALFPPPLRGRVRVGGETAGDVRQPADAGSLTPHPNPPPQGGRERTHPIDAFVLARLEKEGLTPSPEAARETWLRRVSLDLTGLPPTPAEIDAFLADRSPTAHEAVVDRLLASPRYAERMASDWLDVARFADTAGYQADRARPMWAYRDWVLKAFARNQRFDQFLTDQLAGDLLPDPTKDQRLATAFNRLHMQNEEGGIVEEEYRVAYVVDRVDTMGTAFLAMTFECSRCHDHKYDPTTQKDFYSLFALFQNIDEAGQTSYFTDAMPAPTVLLSTAEQDAKLAALAKDVAAKEAAVVAVRAAATPAFEAWLKAKPDGGPLAPRAVVGSVPPAAHEPFDRGPLAERADHGNGHSGPVAEYTFDAWRGAVVANGANPALRGKAVDRPKQVPGKVGRGAELDGEDGFAFPGVGHFTRSDPFTLALWVNPAALAPRQVVVHHSRAPVDAGSRGYEVLLEDGRVAVGLHHMWPGNSLKVVTKKAVAAKAWTHLTVTHDGSGRAAGVRVYIDGEPADTEVVRDGLAKDITYDGAEPDLTIGSRFRDAGFKGGAVDEFRVYDRAVTGVEAAALAGRPAPTDRAALFEHFLATAHGPARDAAKELHAARAAQAKFMNAIPEAMAMKELPAPKPAFVLKRGAYDAPGDPVTPGTPGFLPPFPADQPRNRLGLARWLTQPDHPLTARVTVNRLWQQMFGKGLVETSDNFGLTGATPTHPELLDWLARDFVESGWDVKRCLKQIALSATYRQSSRRRAEGGRGNETPNAATSSGSPSAFRLPPSEDLDPNNQLLARFPARRLTAEMLRDQALFVGGLLVEKQGGPSVYPYQPAGLWDEAMGRPKYPQSKGSDLYRRSLYTVWKRTAPHPQMTTFDAADRSLCSARRQSTGTPLQALALLNDPQLVEAARFLGQRMLKEGGATAAERAAWAFRTVLGRTPSDRELSVLVRLFDEQKAEFAADPKAADKLLAVGEAKPDAALDRVELAAAAALGLAVLNHDEAVNRR